MTEPILRLIAADDIAQERRSPLDRQTLSETGAIMQDVYERGESGVCEYAVRFGEIQAGEPLLISRDELEAAKKALDARERELLERTAERIHAFAAAQRAALVDIDASVPGGRAGHWIAPVETAGCYAPGGRYPLPSSVLMTAVTARAAGVKSVIVASPKPTSTVLAAAAIADADAVLRVGGAQAIAAMAYGVRPVPACDIIVGPGNRWVTAAKQLVNGTVLTDLPAGPSELLIIADSSASPQLIAADLLAQAEHDPDALPMAVLLHAELLGPINEELERQLRSLPTADIARRALANGFAVAARDVEAAVSIADILAPEHLQLMFEGAAQAAAKFQHFGALFIGEQSAEVLGDYGAGPNHVLPTSGAARFAGGLSVFSFLRVRTWLQITDAGQAAGLRRDACALAALEGLEAHRRAAALRGL